MAVQGNRHLGHSHTISRKAFLFVCGFLLWELEEGIQSLKANRILCIRMLLYL